jgi:hypothetical protein
MDRRTLLTSLMTAPAWRLTAQDAARPRLLLDARRLERLRSEIRTTHAAVWEGVRRDADSWVRRDPPAYAAPADPNDEQLWQREVGNKLPLFAMAHLLTGEARYLDAAVRWSLACCAYPHWGAGREDGVDLAAGHQLFGLALVYDWLFDALGAEARATIHRTLLERGRVMYSAAKGDDPAHRSYWSRSFLQNHLWVNACGLAAAAVALSGESGTSDWFALALDKFRRTEAALGPDGASHEGVSYWSYGAEYLLKFWQLAGENPSSPWWKNTAHYRLYLSLPRGAWTRENTIVDLADSPRWDWYGPDYQLHRLAALHRDPHAQWLAGEVERAGATNNAARWLNLLWYDPSVEARPPADLPTLRHFADMGIVSARSGWDGGESLLVFKCGPPLGHEATGRFAWDAGSGHVHPDANHFVLFGAGEWLLKDEGYAWKQTSHHNTLLVDGKGQLGEGAMWFHGAETNKDGVRPRILRAQSGSSMDEIHGDAAPIYPAYAGLRRFTRRLYFLKPDVLVVADDIATEKPRHLELRFHPEHPWGRDGNSALVARGRGAVLRMQLLTPEGVSLSLGKAAGRDREGKEMMLEAARLETERAEWRNIVAFSWSRTEPVRVTLEGKAGRWRVRAGERVLDVGAL